MPSSVPTIKTMNPETAGGKTPRKRCKNLERKTSIAPAKIVIANTTGKPAVFAAGTDGPRKIAEKTGGARYPDPTGPFQIHWSIVATPAAIIPMQTALTVT